MDNNPTKSFQCKQLIGGFIQERSVRFVLGKDEFCVYDMIDNPLETWSYNKIYRCELQKSIFSNSTILIDMGCYYYKNISITSPQAEEAVKIIHSIFQRKSNNSPSSVDEEKVFEVIQRYRVYEEINVQLDISANEMKMWKIPSVEENQQKTLLKEYPLSQLDSWSTHGSDKLLLNFSDLLLTTSLIIVSNDPRAIISAVEAVLGGIK